MEIYIGVTETVLALSEKLKKIRSQIKRKTQQTYPTASKTCDTRWTSQKQCNNIFRKL